MNENLKTYEREPGDVEFAVTGDFEKTEADRAYRYVKSFLNLWHVDNSKKNV
jgi:hypothetical protein